MNIRLSLNGLRLIKTLAPLILIINPLDKITDIHPTLIHIIVNAVITAFIPTRITDRHSPFPATGTLWIHGLSIGASTKKRSL